MAYLVIYYNRQKTCKQVVRPTAHFDGNWTALAFQISKSDDHKRNYSHYEIKK